MIARSVCFRCEHKGIDTAHIFDYDVVGSDVDPLENKHEWVCRLVTRVLTRADKVPKECPYPIEHLVSTQVAQDG